MIEQQEEDEGNDKQGLPSRSSSIFLTRETHRLPQSSSFLSLKSENQGRKEREEEFDCIARQQNKQKRLKYSNGMHFALKKRKWDARMLLFVS